jgi:hypothetical protein
LRRSPEAKCQIKRGLPSILALSQGYYLPRLAPVYLFCGLGIHIA